MKKRNSSNKVIMLFITFVVVLILIFGVIRITYSYKKNLRNEEIIESLNRDIEQEKKRTLELEKEYNSVNTREYIERVGRTKFGLIYPDEILIDVINR